MRHSILLLLLLVCSITFAYTPSESAKISVLTCSSGKEVYKVYGHTALRFHDLEQKKDIVYNYGMFSFDEPHFIMRFVRGFNYYLLGRESYRNFSRRYQAGGETVTEQVLNLTPEELKALFKALEINARPENRKYLYNVLYDNCATRVYDIIGRELKGGIIWDYSCEEASFRDLLHEYNYIMPFSQMGIDIVFGPRADKITTFKEQMFLPEKLMHELATAKKQNGSKLVSSTTTLIQGRKIHSSKETFIFHILLGTMVILSLYFRFKFTQGLRSYRIILYSLAGLASLMVVFIAFFSIHPTVLPNLNLIWLNPVWLVIAGVLIAKKQSKVFWQKLLNIWSIVMALFLILGLAGLFHLHYGLIYIISSLVMISYKRY